MERLTDPLTTIDAKLWADEFMKVKARLGEQEFDHAMMLGWFANAIMQGYDEGQRRAKADVQATIAALTKERDEAVQARQSMLQAMANWLAQLRSTHHPLYRKGVEEVIAAAFRGCQADKGQPVLLSEWQAQEICLAKLQAALDAEREKVKALDAMYRQQLEGRDKRIENLAGSAKIWMEKLTQIQALVRAASERWRAQTNVKEGISFRMAMKALEATLDATTPATMGSNILEEDIGKAMMRSKGGDGESQRI